VGHHTTYITDGFGFSAEVRTPVLVVSDESGTVVAIPNDAEGRALMAQIFPRNPIQPKPARKSWDEQVAELREAAKTNPVLFEMFPSLRDVHDPELVQPVRVEVGMA